MRVVETFGGGEITFQVGFTAASEALYITADQAIRDAFSKRRVRILFELGSTTRVDWDPAGSGAVYAFNQAATVTKIGTPGADTERSALYEVTLTAELVPEDSASGQAEGSTSIQYNPNRQRVVTFRGRWTSIGSQTSSLANYLAGIAAFTASNLTAISASATFEKIDENVEMDDDDKAATYEVVYREKINTQDGTSLDAAGIVEDSLTWRDAHNSPGDSGAGIKRLRDITCEYACEVDITNTVALETLYTDTIRPFLIDKFVSKYSPSTYWIEQEVANPNQSFNRWAAVIVFKAVLDGSDVIQSNVTSRIVENSGIELTGAWTGGIFDKYADQGIATRRRFTIRATEVLGSIKPKERVGGGGTVSGIGVVGGAPAFDSGSDSITGGDFGTSGNSLEPSGGSGPSKKGWQLIDNDSASTVLTRGQVDGEQQLTTLIVETVVHEWIDDPGSGREFGLSLFAEGSTGGISL